MNEVYDCRDCCVWNMDKVYDSNRPLYMDGVSDYINCCVWMKCMTIYTNIDCCVGLKCMAVYTAVCG